MRIWKRSTILTPVTLGEYGDSWCLLLFGSFGWKQIRECLKTRLGLPEDFCDRVDIWTFSLASVTSEFIGFHFHGHSYRLASCTLQHTNMSMI